MRPVLEEHPILQKIELIETLGEDELFANLRPIWDEIILALFKIAMVNYPTYGPWLPHLCEPKGIGEPLKVRIITKSTWVNQLLKPIQQAWHSTLKQDPTFELIGGTPVYLAVSDLSLDPRQRFVSGDYESATDRIHLHYTLFTASEMIDHTDFTFPKVLEELLVVS